MRRERLLLFVLIGLLLGGGLLVGQYFAHERAPEENPNPSPILDHEDPELAVFRNWLWERRGLDLLVQIALVFAGTLGVAAILPNSGEDPRPAVPPMET